MDLDFHGWVALATLACATTLFITRWIPLPVTAFGIPVVLTVTGVLDSKVALAGFGNNAVIAIGAIFVVGAALRESGVATLIARGLQRVGGKTEFGLVILLMAATSLLAAFMNNTAVVAILLPVGMALSRRSNLAPSRLLMPMSFAAVLGGTISLIGTAPNFIVADYYNTGDFEGSIGVFDFANVGIPITVVGVIFMAVFGRRMLPTIRTEDRLAGAEMPSDVASSYGVSDKLHLFRLVQGSSITGQTIAEADIRNRHNLVVVMVNRPGAIGRKWLQPEPDLTLEAEDRLYMSGSEEAAWKFSENETLQMGLVESKDVETILGRGATMAEVAVSPHSRLMGGTFKSIDFRKRFDLNVLALFRRGEVHREDVADLPLQMGDAFLVSGRARDVRALAKSPDFVVLTDQSQVEDLTRAPLAIGILLLALLPPVLIDFPLPISAMGAAILMILTRCISRAGLRHCMDWPVLCLIIGTLPLGKALSETGIAGGVADWITAMTSSGLVIYAILFVLGAAFSMLASNAAAAAIVAPVAVAAANAVVGLEPKAALLAMAYGCSCNFIVPYSQCNLLVMAPGGYQAKDFVRAGIALSLVMAVTTIGVLALIG